MGEGAKCHLFKKGAVESVLRAFVTHEVFDSAEDVG